MIYRKEVENMCGSDVEMDDYGRTALTGDSGPIDDDYAWEETVDVSDDD